MTTLSDPPVCARSPLWRTLVDFWVMATAAMATLFLVTPDISWFHPDTRQIIVDYLSTILLLGLAIGAVLSGVGRLESQRERWFWRLFGLSLSAWLAGEAIAILLVDAHDPVAEVGVDGLYLLFYLGFVLALDIQPQLAGDPWKDRQLRIVASVGRTLLLAGLFVYFVLLPRIFGVEENISWISSFTFYVVLDAYLVGRLLSAALRADEKRWRVVFTLLAASMTFVLTTDGMDLAWIAEMLPDTLPRPTDCLWYAPMILIAVASRARHALAGAAEIAIPPADEDQLRGVPLLVYSLAFVLIHLAFSLVSQSTAPVDEARVIVVMAWLVLFGGLNVVQHSLIQRWMRRQRRRRREAEAVTRELLRQDPLTGLLNRRTLDLELAKAVARAERTGLSLALMFIDLDHFKVINDTFGHRVGDGVLREATTRLEECSREVDTLARYGGDEFVLVLEALVQPGDAEVVGRRILDSFDTGFEVESGRFELSASIGIAILPLNGDTPSQLFEAADRAMYAVKNSGGAGVAMAAPVGPAMFVADDVPQRGAVVSVSPDSRQTRP